MNRKIGIVIVSYGHEGVIPNLVSLISSQMERDDKIVVVDNHPNKKCFDRIKNNKAINFAIKQNNTGGFSGGCNIGAAKIIDTVDILFFINPDTLPKKNVLRIIRDADYSRYAVVMPLLTLSDGTVNSAGNVVHISGLSWCDGYGKPEASYKIAKDISVASGACMAVSKVWWKNLGGLSESFFMYYEDTDFSTRALLQGGKLVLLPDAHVIHDYDYGKGSHKWLYIERNRLVYIIRTWPASVITVLSVQLLFVEIGLWLVALIQGRGTLKLKALPMTIKAIPSAIKDRRNIQKNRDISGYDFLKTLTYKLDTPLLGNIGNNKVITFFYKTYYVICLYILKSLKL